MPHPTTEALITALARVDAAVADALAVAWLLPGEVSPDERPQLAAVAVDAYEAADGVVVALMPLIALERPRGSLDALDAAAGRAWMTAEHVAALALRAREPAVIRAADRAQALAVHASQQAHARHADVCGWLSAALEARQAA